MHIWWCGHALMCGASLDHTHAHMVMWTCSDVWSMFGPHTCTFGDVDMLWCVEHLWTTHMHIWWCGHALMCGHAWVWSNTGRARKGLSNNLLFFNHYTYVVSLIKLLQCSLMQWPLHVALQASSSATGIKNDAHVAPQASSSATGIKNDAHVALQASSSVIGIKNDAHVALQASSSPGTNKTMSRAATLLCVKGIRMAYWLLMTCCKLPS